MKPIFLVAGIALVAILVLSVLMVLVGIAFADMEVTNCEHGLSPSPLQGCGGVFWSSTGAAFIIYGIVIAAAAIGLIAYLFLTRTHEEPTLNTEMKSR